jgi:hypothetical protein
MNGYERQALADAQAHAFDPYYLRPLASLNRRRTIALPGLNERDVGKSGSELLSKAALVRLIRPHVRALQVEGTPDGDLPPALNRVLSGAEGPRRALAESIAERHGRLLGYLIASILLSPRGLTDPMVAWEKAFLAQWRERAQEIVLGGGRATGRLGELIRDAAQEALARCGLERRLSLADHPSYLPVIGAARCVPLSGNGAVVFDFGGSRAKRGIAVYDREGALCRLRVLPPRDTGHLMQVGKTAELAAEMVALIAETIRAVEPSLGLAPSILCSLGAYVENGEPVRMDRGPYTWLHRLSPDLRAWFNAQIGAATDRAVEIEFLHDCDVAACALAGRPNAAVLMMGSALGIGFVPPGEGYRALAEGFAVEGARTRGFSRQEMGDWLQKDQISEGTRTTGEKLLADLQADRGA